METVKEENEKKKEYLKQYGKALRQEKRIEEELERLKLDRMLPGALAADGLPKSSNLSDLSDYAAEVDEQERKLVEQRKRRVRIRTEIRERIEQIEDETEKDILTYHYIDLISRWKIMTRQVLSDYRARLSLEKRTFRGTHRTKNSIANSIVMRI